jgi:uncharacterized membrane protein YfcA
MFDLAVAVVAVIAGATAGVAGFGIGSLLTPLFALRFGTKLAVAIVSIPHLIATAYRFVTVREHVDRAVLIRFGILSAIGGLVGAILNARVDGPAITMVFAVLLLFAGLSGVTGFAERMRFGRKTAWIAGALSGLFGGMVGNQGGIRSAALLGFDIPKESFVATATAIALVVDGARMPVYLVTQHSALAHAWVEILVATIGGIVGTMWGVRLLRRIPERIFRRSVGALIFALGIYMLAKRIAEVS